MTKSRLALLLLAIAFTSQVLAQVDVNQEPTLADGDSLEDRAYLTVQGKDFFDLTMENNAEGYFVFFGAGWCGHCRNFKPAFSQIAKKCIKNELPINPTFILYEVESKDPITTFFKVNAYPTLIYIRDGKYCKYSGSRDETSLSEFFQQNLDKDYCLEYLKSYPSWVEQLQNSTEEFWGQFWNEAYYYIREYPKSSWGLIAFLGICMIINIFGLFFCIHDLCCKKKVTKRPTLKPTQDQKERTSETPRESNREEIEMINVKRESKTSSQPEEQTEEISNTKKRSKRE